MENKINIIIGEGYIYNPNIMRIVNKLEEEIKILVSEICCYEFAKCNYSIFEHYNNELRLIFEQCQEYDTCHEKHEIYQRIIKYLTQMSIKIRDDNKSDFDKLHEIRKKKDMIVTLKTLGNDVYSDEILEIIKNKFN